jgi:3-oxoacyl-[acyl-carrier-protein] synthase II
MTPVANSLNEFADAIFSGKNGVGPIQSFDTSKHDIKHGGEVKGFEPGKYFEKLNCEDFDRSTQLAVATSKLAFELAGLDKKVYEPRKMGCIFGTTMGNQQTIEKYNDMIFEGKVTSAKYRIRNFQPNLITSAVAAELELKGPNLVIPTACAAGNYAIGYASDLIKSGKADCVICGGSDAISRVCFTMFLRLGAMTPDLCRPFDGNRHGMIVSEGAAALVLESYENAKKRNAKIYADVAGYGNSCDAYHVTAPHPEGRGAMLAIQKALDNSSVNKKDIQYISVHGTGTKANDAAEAFALGQVFGNDIRQVPISSIKSMIGHTMGAAAAIEAVASILVLNEKRLPVNMNLENLDQAIQLNVVKDPAEANIQCVLSNSFAFGGNISCIVLRRGD